VKLNIKKIKEVLLKHRGGLEQADDDQLMAIWNSLLPADQEGYLKTMEKPKAVPSVNGIKKMEQKN